MTQRIAILVVICSLLFAGCTTLQTRSVATAKAPSLSFEEAYRAATQAAISAGFTIMSTDKDSGLITATRGANPMLTWQNPVINISVAQYGETSQIKVSSTVGGQMNDWGVTKKTIQDYCDSLRGQLPSVQCSPN
jgi:hypothetical protein